MTTNSSKQCLNRSYSIQSGSAEKLPSYVSDKSSRRSSSISFKENLLSDFSQSSSKMTPEYRQVSSKTLEKLSINADAIAPVRSYIDLVKQVPFKKEISQSLRKLRNDPIDAADYSFSENHQAVRRKSEGYMQVSNKLSTLIAPNQVRHSDAGPLRKSVESSSIEEEDLSSYRYDSSTLSYTSQGSTITPMLLQSRKVDECIKYALFGLFGIIIALTLLSAVKPSNKVNTVISAPPNNTTTTTVHIKSVISESKPTIHIEETSEPILTPIVNDHVDESNTNTNTNTNNNTNTNTNLDTRQEKPKNYSQQVQETIIQKKEPEVQIINNPNPKENLKTVFKNKESARRIYTSIREEIEFKKEIDIVAIRTYTIQQYGQRVWKYIDEIRQEEGDIHVLPSYGSQVIWKWLN